MASAYRYLVTSVFVITSASLAPTPAQGGAATGPYAAQVKELHAIAHLLNLANHDYKGHRAKAVHEIHLAIHILHPGHHKKHNPDKKGPTPKGGNNEPQSVSDAQLRQAIDGLKTVQGQLGSAPPHALAATRAAIHQLQIALTIR